VFKIRWSESEFVTIFLAVGLLVIKAGFIFIFSASFVLILYQRGMIHGLSLPLIIPSMQQIGIPFAQNDDSNPRSGAGQMNPLIDSTLEPSAMLQDEQSTQAIVSAAMTAVALGTPASEMTGLPGETGAITFTETPVLPEPMSEEPGTQIPILPWVQTLSEMCTPIEGIHLEDLAAIVSSPYKPPPPGSDARHMGVDFAYYRRDGQNNIDGKEVYALLPGKVVSVINDRIPYGNLVIIETRYSDVSRELADAMEITPERSLYHLYGHMKFSPPVFLGQQVPCGYHIGNVGNSGTQVPHLHLETRWGPVGGWFPAMGYLGQDTSEDEKDNYLYWRISGVYQHFDPFDLINAYMDFVHQKE
jgi:murein DD-endopeptidase MepM/ murein hydrolase activator NlpD